MIPKISASETGRNLKWAIRIFSFCLLISLTVTNTFGQVTGTPSSGQSAVQQCSPAIYDISYKFTFLTPANPTGIVRLLFILYTSGNTLVSSQNFPNVPIKTGVFKYVEQSATFSIPYTGDCEYYVEILLYYDGVYVNSAYQIQRIGIWHIDNQANGVIAITPNIQNVCLGTGLTNFRFQDASTFACVTPTGQNPNIIERHVQFIYGTNFSAAQGIPNLYINDGVSDIYLTDGSGNRIVFPTASTYYEGPIISTGPFPLGGSQLTYPIFFDGVGTAVNDYFEVTVRNWNFCNPWNGDPVNPNIPVTTSTARIVIVDGPTVNAGPDQLICSTSSATLAGSRGGTATGAIWSGGAGSYNPNNTTLNAVYTPSAAEISAGTVTLTLTTTGASGLCPNVSDAMTITINQAATVNAGPDQTVCSSSPAVTTAGTRGGSATSSTWTTSGTGTFVNSTLLVTTYNPSAADIAAGTITLTLTTNDPAGPCPAVNDAMVVTINPAATVSAGVDQTICAGSTATTAGTRGGGATSSTWTTSGTGTFANAANLITTYTPSAADISAGSVTLTLTTNNPAGPCPAVSDAMVLTINPAATVSAGVDQTVCSSSPIITTAGTRGGSAATSTWTTSGTGFFGNAAQLITTYNPSAADIAAGTVTLTITTNDPAGPCPAVNDAMLLTINPAATVSAGVDQTICAGTSATTAGTRGGGATSSTWTTSGTGTFGNAANLITTYTPSAADILAGSVTLTITTNDPAGPCPSVNDAMILTINPAATVSAGVDQTVCSSSPAVTTAGTRGGSAASSTWTTSGTGTFVNATLLITTYNPSAADIAAGTVTLTLTTNDPAGPCPAVNDAMVVTINPAATVSAGVDQTICAGTSATTAGTRGGGATSSTWTTSGTGTFGNAANLITTYTPSAADILAGSVTLTITTNDPAGPCPSVNDAMVLTINPAATVGAGVDQTVCSSSPAVTTAGTRGGSATSSTWTTSGTGTFVNATLLITTYNPSAADIAAGTVTLTLTTNDPAGPCPAVNDAMIVTINPAATVSAGVDQTICEGSVAALVGSRGGGATTSTWTSSGSGTFANAALVNTTYTPSAADILAGTITLTITTNDPAGPCPSVNDAMILTINPAATVNAGPDQSICALASATLAGSFGGGAASATWSGGTGTYAPNNTTMNAVYTPSAAERTAGTVTLTLTTNDPAGPCPAVNDNITITIGSTPATATLTGSGNICYNTASSYIRSVITGGAPPYTINYTLNGIAQPAITPYTSGTNYNLGVLAVGTYTYVITSVTDACGNSVPGGGLPGSYVIVINEVPDLSAASANPCSDVATGITFGITNFNATYCSGITYNITNINFNGLTASAGAPATGTGFAANVINDDAYTNTTGADVNVVYTVVPVSAQGCTGLAETVTVTVKSEPKGWNATTSVCSETALAYNLQTSVINVVPGNSQPSTFTWVAADNVNVTGESLVAQAGNIINNTLVNTTNTAQTVTYTVTPTGSNLCVGNTFTVTVTVSPKPAINNLTATTCSATAFTVTPANGADGIVPAGTTYTWGLPVVTGGLTGGATGTNAANISGNLTNPTNTAQTATYTVTPTSGGCAGSSFTVTVTVNPKPAVSNKTATICSGSVFTVTPVNGGAEIVPVGTTYTWTAPVIAPLGSITGGSAQAVGQASISQTLTNTTNAVATATYTVTPLSGSCTGSTFTVTVTVNPMPAINNMTSSSCSATAFTVSPANGANGIVPAGTTYTWGLPVVTGGLTGGATGTNQANISGNLTNPTNTAQTATYTVTPTSGTCTGATFTVTVTINPKATINNLTATTCSATGFTVTPANGADGIVPAGTTYTWGLPVVTGGLTGGATGTNQANISGNLTNPTNTAQTATYTVTPTSGGCTGANFTVTVTVNPKPAIANKTATICSATAFTVTPVNGGAEIVPAGTTYTWGAPVIAPLGAITGGSAQAVGQPNISQTLTNTTNVVATATYTVTPLSGSCTGSTFTVTVTVNPKPTISDKTSTICSAGTFTVTPVNGGAEIVPAGTTYTWGLPVVTGGITGGATGTNLANISGTLTNPTNTPQTATYTVTPTSGTCSGATFTVTVTVNPKPAVANKTATICSATAFTVTPVNGGAEIVPAGTTYTWTAPVIAPLGAITGGSAQAVGQASISQTLTNTTNAVATATYTVTPLSGSCTGSTFTVTVTVDPKATIANKTATICDDGTFTVTPVNGGAEIVPAGTTYTWGLPVVTGGLTGGATGTNLANISGTLSNPTNSAQTATYTVTPTSGSCTGASFTVTVTVNPKPAISNKTTTICSATAFTVAPVNGGAEIVPAGTTYTWTAPVIAPLGAITGGSAQAVGQPNISQTLTNTTNAVATATYTVTPLAGSCTGATFTVTVTVDPRPAVTNMTATVCNAVAFTVTPVNGANGIVPAGTTYTWGVPVVTGGMTGGSTGLNQANITGTLTNPTSSPQTATYTVTPTSGSCTGANFTVTVTVNPGPAVNNMTASSCSATAFTVTPVDGVNGIVPAGITYTWPAPVVTGGITGGAAGTAQPNIPGNLTNPTSSPQTATYTVTPTAGSCTGTPFTLTVTINPKPAINNLVSSTCSNSAFTVSPADGADGIVPAGTTYSWPVPVVTGGMTGGATGTNQASIGGTLINSTNVAQTATYTVTPLSGTCTGASFTVTITVNPVPAVTPMSATICSEATFTVTPANGLNGIVPAGTTYSWGLPVVTGGITGGATGSGAANISGTLVNPTTAVQTATYTVTPLSGTCAGATFNVIVTVNPLPQTLPIAGDATLCESATNKVYQVPNTPGSTYTWTVPASLTRTSPQGLYFIIVDANGPSLPGEKITVTETFTSTTGCVGLPVEKFITVVATIPGEVVGGPASVCQGATGVVYSVTDNPGSVYSWVVPAGATITSDPTLHQISVNFTMAGSGDVSVVETNGAVCTTVHVPKTVTINALPTVYNVTAPPAYCTGGTGVTVTLSNSQTGVNYQLFKDGLASGGPQAGSTGSALTWINNLVGSYTVVATNATTACTQAMNGTAVVTINNVTGGTIGTDHAICEGAAANPLTNSVAGTGGGTITYQWQSSLDNFATAPTNIVGATSAVYTPGTLTQDTYFRRVAYSTMGSSVCSDFSNTVLVTVINFVPGSITADQTICENDTPAAFGSVTPSGDGVFTYKWQSSTDGITYADIIGETSETYTPSAGIAADTWYKRLVTSTVAGVPCTEETNAVKVTVINFTPGSIATDQTICYNTAPATFTSVAPSGDGIKTYQWQSSPDGLAPWTDIGGANSATYTSGALTADTYFRRKVTSTLNAKQCDQYTNSVRVTINDFDPGTISAAQTICEGDAPAAFTSVTPTGVAGALFTYQWQSSVDNVTYSNIPGATSETYTSGPLTMDTYFRRRVTSTLNLVPCTEFTPEILITVNNFTPGTIIGNQTVCETEIPAAFTETAPAGDGGFTYQWEISTDNTTWNPIALATAATYAPPVALAQDTWYRRQVTSTLGANTCTEVTNTIKVTVNNFVPGSIGTDQTICENTSAAALTSVTPTGDGVFTYKWFVSTDGVGFVQIGGAISETYSPGVLAADRWYKREVTSTLSGKACSKETNVIKITVNNMLPGSITADQTICDGGTPVAFGSAIATGDGTITYQWMESINGVAFSNIAGATSETFTAPALTQDTWYRRSATSTIGGNACTEESNLVKVTVINFLPGSIGTDRTICNGTAPAAFTSVAPSGDGVFTYQWESSPDGIAWADILGANGATYTSPALAADTYFRRKVTSTVNGVPCTLTTNQILVTVINFVPGTISADQTICEGDTPAAFTSVTPTGDGAFTYQWQYSTDGASYANIAGATSETFAPGALTVDTWYRRQVISTLNGTQCTQLTAAVKVTVNNFSPGSISAAQTICEGDNPAAFTSVTPTGDGAITYQWQSSMDGITFGNIAGETNETYDAPVLTQDTWYKRLVTSTLSGSICTEETNTLKITVNNFVPGSISGDQTICENITPAPLGSVAPTGDGIFTYRWFSSPDGAAWTVIGGAISETYSPGLLTADTHYKREVTSTLLGKACVEETNVVVITVNNMLPGSISADQTICDGAVPAAFSSTIATGDGAITYQWYESLNGITFTSVAGATLDTYAPPALTQDTWFRRDATSTIGVQTCTEESNIVRVTVNNFLPGSIGSDQTICEGTAPAAFTSVAASGDGSKAYQWQSSPDGLAPWTDIPAATSATYTSPALTADTYFRRRVTSTLNTIPCIQYTNTVVVTVNNMDPGSIAAAQTICEGDTPAAFTSIDATGDGAITYQWQISTDGASFNSIPGETNATYASGALTVDTWFRRQATSTLNSTQCVEYTASVKVTVNNFTAGSISAAQTICEGDDPAAFTAVAPAGDGTFTFQWQSSTDGVAFANIALATAATYDAPALTQDTWYKRLVTSDLGGKLCVKETNTIKVTVNNFDPGSIGSDQIICENSIPAGLTSVTPTGDGVFTYKWYNSTDGISFAVIAGAISETYNPPALTADMWYRREVTSTLSGKACSEITNTVNITVNNMLPGTISADETICEGDVPAALGSTLATGDGAITYQWKESVDGIAFTDIAGATSATYAPPALTVDTWYKRAATSTLGGNLCTEESNIVRITVINFLPGSIDAEQTICEGTAPAAFTSVAASGDGVKTYQWQNSTDGAIFANIGGATGATYTSPAITQDTWFRRLAISTLNGKSCTEISGTLKVTVNNFDPGSIAAAQTICEGDTPAAFSSAIATGDGAITYQWQNSTDGVSFVSIPGANSETYAAGSLTQDTWYRRQVTSTLNSNTCVEYTASVKVTVNNFTPGSISAAQTICEGDDPAAFTAVAPAGDGTFTFQWQSSTDGIAFANIALATAATYDSPALTQDTWFRRLVTSDLGGSLCTEETNTVKVTVNNFDPGSIGTDQTICENTAPSPLTSVTPTGDGTFTYRWLSSPDGATFNPIAGAISETYNPPALAADTWYRREVTSTLPGKACIEFTNDVKITVNNMLPGVITADETICEGAVPAAFGSTAATGDGTITYQWMESINGIAFTNIVGATNELYVAPALTQDTWYKRAATSTAGASICTVESNVIKVTVVNFLPGSIGSDQTICESTAPAAFTSVAPTGDGVFSYRWESSPNGLAPWTVIAGATGATYTSVALTADTYFRREVTSTLNGEQCVQYTNTVLVTVNNFDPGSIAAAQTICEGDTPAAFTSVTPTGDGTFTYQWQRSTDGVTFVNITGATSETYTSVALTQDTWFRREVTSTLNGTLCTEYTAAVKVTVNNFTPGSISAAQTICEGDDPAAFTAVAPAGDGTFTFQWQSSTDGITFGDIGGATSATYDPPALAADTWYRRMVTSTLSSVPCALSTNTVKVTVNNFDPGSIGSDETICEGAAPSALTSVSPTGDGAFTFRWFSSADGITFGTLIVGAVSETYNPGALTADTWFRREVTSTLSGKACVENTNAVKITVNNFVPGSITADQTICEGSVPAPFGSTTPSGDAGAVFTYQWKVSTDGVAFTDIVGANLETYASGALNVDTWFKRAVTSTMGVNTCTEETNAVKVTVINFTPGNVTADQTICEATVPATFSGSSPVGDGTFTYQWQNSTDGIAFADIAGATGPTYTSPALSTETWFRRRSISTLNATSCSLNTNSVKVTINRVDPGTIGAAQTICEGTAPLMFSGTVPTGDGVLTYQWSSSIDGVSFTNITGATSSTYTSGALVQDTWFRREVISTLNGVLCGETSPAVKVTVNNFIPGTISAAQTICDGTAPVAFTSVTPTGDGTFTYQWQSSTDNVTFTDIGGATNETYTSGILTQDTWFKRLVTSTLSGNVCTEETNSVLVTVINFLPGSISSDQTICENSMPVPLSSVTPTGDGVFTYRWFVSTDGVGFSLIAGAIYETYAPGSLAADRWYKREVTATLNGKACVAETNVVHITVNNFVPGSVAGDQTLCEGGTPAPFTSITPTGDGTFTYQWRSSTDGVNYIDITGATSDTYSAGALNQDTWYKRVVISTLNGIPCTKETAAIKVTVNNVNAGTIISDQTICIGSDPVSFWSVVAGTGDGAVTYQWQSSTDNVTFTDVAGATALTYDAPAISADTWYRRVTTSVLNAVTCTKISNVVRITVNTVTGGTITANQTICFGSTPAPFGSSDDGSGTGTVSYQWQRSSDNVIFSTIPGATSTTYAPGVLYTDTWYKRTIISIQNGVLCTTESNTIKITINPLPIAVLSGGATICPTESAILKVEMMAGTGPYELDIENLGTITGYASNADITVTPAVTTTYKLLRVRDANGCQIVSPSANLIGTATVTVRALPAITTSPVNKVVCEFGVTTFTVAATGSDLTYQWYVNDGAGFDPITDGGIYFGANTTTLNLFGATRDMNGYQYHAVVTGCSTNVTSADAILTVNTPAEINIQPKDSTICMGGNAAFGVTAMGTSITYKWQVNKGAGFIDVVNDANFGGAATNTLTVTNAPGTFNNYIFRVIVKGTCGVPVYSNFVVLRVYVPPTVTLNPVAKTICDGGGPITFIGNGTGQIDSLRWQVFSGGIWSDIHDDAIYSGTTSQQLTLSNIPVALNGNQYRLGLKARCTTVYTNAATLTVNANPVVTFTSPIAACGDVPLTLTPTITGGSGTWSQHLWTGDVGPLNNYFVRTPTFRSQIANSYVLNYRVRDNNGCYGNSDVTVVVDAPDAEFIQDAMNGCTPLTVNFSKDMTGYTSFTWDFGDGSAVNTTQDKPAHTFTNTNPASIEYRNVKLTVTSAGGCTDTFTSTVTVYPAVNASFTANKTVVCSGQPISFATSPGASKYFWEFGDGSSGYSPSESTTHLYTNFTTSPLVLTVKLTTTSFYNCSDDETMTITVMPVPTPQFVAVPPSQIYDPAGNQVAFTNQTNAGTWTWSWKFGDGGTSAASDPTHTYTALGTYKVVLKVNNANCADSVSHEVRILPPPPVADFDTIMPECAPMAITMNNTSTNTNVPVTTYRWDFGDGSTSTAKNPSYTWFDPGTYRVELTVTGPGGVSTKSQIVKVYESPKVYFEITPTLVFVNDEKVRGFNLTTPTTGLTYLWEFGDGDTSKVKEPFHKYMEEGVYDVTLWAYMTHPDGKTCSDKFVLSPAVTVEPAGEIRFSTVFTPNTSGEEVVDDLGQINSGNVDRFFYPPIREKVLDYKLQIFNRLGVLIYQTDNINKPWNGYYKGQLCPQGVYVWYVEGKYANGMPFKKVGDVTLLH